MIYDIMAVLYERIVSDVPNSITYMNRFRDSPKFIRIHDDGSWAAFKDSPDGTPNHIGDGETSLKRVLSDAPDSSATDHRYRHEKAY